MGEIIDYEAIGKLAREIIDYETIDYETIEKLADELGELFRRLGEAIGKFINDNINEIIERLKEAIDKSLQYGDKLKYKPVKSLIKPYKQPFIKVRYRARANL